MKLVHLIFYSFYKTASKINRIIPLKGGGIGGASSFLAITSILPFFIIFKFQSHFNFSLKYPVIILVMPILLAIMIYFDNKGNKIVKQIEKEELPIWLRIVLANSFLIIYTAAFIYFFK